MSNALENLNDEQLAREAERIGQIAHEAALRNENPACTVKQLANVVAEHIRRRTKEDE